MGVLGALGIMQFLIVGSLFVAGASAQLVHYPNGAVAPYDPNNAAATAAHLQANAEAGKLINPFGVHEEKYQEQIKQINIRLKQAESRSEYAEMNISKLHLRIDDLEDEIIREKMKINAVSSQLDDTFNEMLNRY